MNGLSLEQWGNIAQFVIAIAGALAIVGAWLQIRSNRANARRVRVYEYADRLNRPNLVRRMARYSDFLEKHDYAHYKTLSRVRRAELLILPNLFEEIAALYHRGLLDRDVASEALGFWIELMWDESYGFISEMRAERGPRVYCDWEAMRADTPARKSKADRKITRKHARRRLLRGT